MIENIKISEMNLCEACVAGKQTRNKFTEILESRSRRPLEIIHTDVCGPMTPDSLNGGRYFVTFIDDYTHFTITYVIKAKSDFIDYFKPFEAMAAAHFGTKIARLRVDNGGEYTLNEFKRLFIEKGVQVEFTVRSTPEQNGVAERLNRTLHDKARTMVHDANLSKSFWSEALYTAAPTRAFRFDDDRSYKTPAELWSGKKPDISKLRIFGCTVYSHIPKEFRKKLYSKTTKLIMVGYAPNGYRLWDGEKRKIVIARDVIFDENIRKTTEVASCENNHFVNL